MIWSEYLELPQYHSHEDLLRVRDGPFGPGIPCPQAIPSSSPGLGPTWNRPAGNCYAYTCGPSVFTCLWQSQFTETKGVSLREIKWNGLTL